MPDRFNTSLSSSAASGRPGEAAAATGPEVPNLGGAIDVRSLLMGAREAVLLLDGEAYRLRITAKEKLILTK